MKQRLLFIVTASALLTLIPLSPDTARAQITLGQSCAMSGPTSFLGIETNRGAAAYFGKYAQDITLTVLDDKYEPEKCIENTNKFLTDKVTALFGYLGTPTSKVALPFANTNKTIFFGAFTGAEFLSDHKTYPYSFSIRTGYDTEIANMIRHLKEDAGITKIALFVQRDSFGLAGVTGAVNAVQKIKGVEIIPPVPEIPKDTAPKEVWDAFWEIVPNFQRNTIAVGRDARKISGNKNVEAVILMGTYRACAAAINLWKQLNFNAVFLNISFVGSRALAESLEGDAKNVLISQVVPNPWDASVPVVKEYQEAVGNGNYEFVSVESYIAAKVIHKAIKDAGASVSSESLKKQLESMSGYDAGGFTVSFGPEDHRGSDTVYLTRIIKNGKDIKFEYIQKIAKE